MSSRMDMTVGLPVKEMFEATSECIYVVYGLCSSLLGANTMQGFPFYRLYTHAIILYVCRN
jgi:hypothetical protein